MLRKMRPGWSFPLLHCPHTVQCKPVLSNTCWNYGMFSLLHASYISVRLKSLVHGQWMLNVSQLGRWNLSDMDFPVWKSQCCLMAAKSTHLLQIYLRELRALDLSEDLACFLSSTMLCLAAWCVRRVRPRLPGISVILTSFSVCFME